MVRRLLDSHNGEPLATEAVPKRLDAASVGDEQIEALREAIEAVRGLHPPMCLVAAVVDSHLDGVLTSSRYGRGALLLDGTVGDSPRESLVSSAPPEAVLAVQCDPDVAALTITPATRLRHRIWVTAV